MVFINLLNTYVFIYPRTTAIKSDFEMSKKKRKTKKQITKEDKHEDYLVVLSAMAYIVEKEQEQEKREEAKYKAQRLIMWFTIVGSVLLVASLFIVNFAYDFSWMANAKKWFSDCYVSFMVYILITDIVFILEKRFNMDQKPVFGYGWPFVGFFISLLITNTVSVSFVHGEIRTIVVMFFILLFPSALMMYYSFKTGKEIANQETNRMIKAKEIIEGNPEIVEQIAKDYKEYSESTKDITE